MSSSPSSSSSLVAVITGSSKGLGRGLALELVRRGCRVVVSARNLEALNQVAEEAKKKDRVLVVQADVTIFAQVQSIWDQTIQKFGRCDIWVNNAGISHELLRHFVDTPIEEVDRIVDVNIKGTLYGSKVALTGMKTQGSGTIYNTEGLGSNGKVTENLIIYGATKSFVTYFTRGLLLESRDCSVQICKLQPGMLVTDLLLARYKQQPEEFLKRKKVLSIMTDKVETVTPYLVDQMIQAPGTDIAWLTTSSVIGRFAMALFYRRDVLDDFENELRASQTS